MSTPNIPSLSGLTLRTRLLAAFLAVSLVSVVVAGFALSRMSSISDRAQNVYTKGTVQLDATRNLQVLWWEYAAHDARVAITGLPPAVLKTETADSARSLEDLNNLVKEVQAMDLSADVAASIDSFADALSDNNTALDALKSGTLSPAESADALAAMSTAAEQAKKAITDANAAEQAAAAEQATAAHDAYTSARTLTLVIIGVGLLLSLGLGLAAAAAWSGRSPRPATSSPRSPRAT